MRRQIIFLLVLSTIALSWAQQRDQAVYVPEKSFYGRPDTILTLDFSRFQHPQRIEDYQPLFHFSPIPQDTTNTCWAFAATSLLESELHRLGRGDIPLSRMHTVYWEYVEKVRRFVQKQGHSLVAPGSQINAVFLRMIKYGAVPADVYTGLIGDQKALDERKMLRELRAYLNYVKEKEVWYEDQVIANTRMILNRYMGPPPEQFTFEGKTFTPLTFSHKVLNLPLNDYVSLISFKKYPFWTRNTYPVPDNWWDDHGYYNVPLDDFYRGLKDAIQKGYSISIAGDVSEPGKYGKVDLAVVPTFDIPASFIDQDSREFRFDNRTSRDDHGVHLVGYKRFADADWFLIKDSAASAWKGAVKGYFFFNGDYIRLKILCYTVHKDAIPEVMQKFAD
ncbi:peptidase C1 [candidate division KSB1 bacterium]|nr:peptidase C1 [candidate division KSB1 bacterium]